MQGQETFLNSPDGERKARDNKRWSGPVLIVFKFKILVSATTLLVLMAGFHTAPIQYSEAMPKIAGALAVWSTLVGFALGWIGDSSKVLLNTKEVREDRLATLRTHMGKLHDQIVLILRKWFGCAILSAITLAFSYALPAVLPKTQAAWTPEPLHYILAACGALALALLVWSQIRFYELMERILRQRFEIEDFSITPTNE